MHCSKKQQRLAVNAVCQEATNYIWNTSSCLRSMTACGSLVTSRFFDVLIVGWPKHLFDSIVLKWLVPGLLIVRRGMCRYSTGGLAGNQIGHCRNWIESTVCACQLRAQCGQILTMSSSILFCSFCDVWILPRQMCCCHARTGQWVQVWLSILSMYTLTVDC